MRLDNYLVFHKNINSRIKAKNLINMGFVFVNNETVTKAGYQTKDIDKIVIKSHNFASVGGFKLKQALEKFNVNIDNRVCLDVGASNGGFTEVLLQNNAKRVYALDVGECALADYIKNDNRVIIKDKLNARNIQFEDIGEKIDLIVIDVSFISLKLIIPNMLQFLKASGEIIALIKPQFEGKKSDLNKKGIVKSKQQVQKTVEDISNFCQDLGFIVKNKIQSPQYFADKNTEWLIYLQR